MKQELERMYDHIDDIEIAMMTTRREDGHLQSRAMATQKPAAGADLRFVTCDGTQKTAPSRFCLSLHRELPWGPEVQA